MSKNEHMDDNVMQRAGGGTIDQPMDESGWQVSGSVINEKGRPVGASFSGNINGTAVGGEAKTGNAFVKVGADDSFLRLKYENERVSGTIGYGVGPEEARLSGTFDSNGNLSGSAKVEFKNTVVDISPASVGVTYNFSEGWKGSVRQEFGGGMGIDFSGGSSFGGGSFSLSLGASGGGGGSWGVNAKFQLILLAN
ncbi:MULTISPECIES: hypothetical protein [Stenotrophomonas]|uniref:hypothetical protein n=1 Tax=Stenotrophomonas TaxID=40323 RepID=UPI000D3B71CD|nr:MULTISPECIES: hypothetical protein [Stenotrophomonas]PTS74005.1 hypothetical protein DBR20_14795 [Stenotrophomonas sp. HMWF023]CAH0160772.1 hypothetical protein SRABI122_00932 [Stenotrophomonas lactitubi]CAH0173926.1 hypothetical protein SRABI102_01098 [Stenotrophomonas lactitubi]CAH0186119.1 hypothetical protein SRABI81_01587 [Stenotrophomonas lactitubi]CAH0201312.1 hypothetical protein SRABI66_01955 [Stenotrophomonas lactitubi]